MWALYVFLTLFSIHASTSENVPVLLWGNFKRNGAPYLAPLLPTTTNQFQHFILQASLKGQHILLFAEHTLSVEDLNENNPEFAFSNIRNLSATDPGFIYLPAVEDPLTSVNNLVQHGYTFVIFEESQPLILKGPTILVVRLSDPDPSQSRTEFLAEHDGTVGRLSSQIQQRIGTMSVIYTAKHGSFAPSSIRRKREDVDDSSPNEIFMSDSDKKIVVATGSPIVYRKGKEVIHLTQVIYASKDTNKNFFALDVKFKEQAISLDLVFSSPSEKQSWSLEAIKVEHAGVELRSKLLIGAPAGYSYFCDRNVTFTGIDQDGVHYSLILQGIQAQPRVKNNAFGPAIDCVPFFSEPILSGLFIVTLLMAVLIMAVLCILDIRTMDHFDDPKGKTITVSNAE